MPARSLEGNALLQSLLLISLGAALGACCRWSLGLWLNTWFSGLAFGTLIANWLGCFLIGILTATFWQYSHFSQDWKLFLVTGFLGALTTFSSFSAEVIELLFKGDWLNGGLVICLHLFGCLGCTFLGIFCYRLISLGFR